MNNACVKTGFGLVLALVFVGCAARTPPAHYYLLEPLDSLPGEALGSVPAGGITIGVGPFEIDPPYDQDRIVYRVGEDSPEVGFYAYHRWAAPLARMVPRVVAAGLGGIDGIKSIEPAIAGRQYDGRVYGRVLTLEEIDTSGGATAHARLMLILVLGDVEIWSGTTHAEATIATRDVGDVVERMRAALSEAVTRARPGVQQALRHVNR